MQAPQQRAHTPQGPTESAPVFYHEEGNLIDMAVAGKFDIVVHGCNCFNTMGAGIAREIATRFPGAYEADLATVPGDYNKLGNFTSYQANLAEDNPGFKIINAYTQYTTASKDKPDVFEYAAFLLICQKLAHMFPGTRIGLPYIGMGLAGGDADAILDTINTLAVIHEETGGTVTLVKFVPPSATKSA